MQLLGHCVRLPEGDPARPANLACSAAYSLSLTLLALLRAQRAHSKRKHCQILSSNNSVPDCSVVLVRSAKLYPVWITFLLSAAQNERQRPGS